MFIQKWGEIRDYGYIFTKFNAMKKKHSEDVSESIKRFIKVYNIFPKEMKPPQAISKVVLARDFEYEFSFTLMERKSRTLDQIQIDALEVEYNFSSIAKLRENPDYVDKRREKEEASWLGQGKETQEQKLEEINKLIKSMSNKLVNLDLEIKIHPYKPSHTQIEISIINTGGLHYNSCREKERNNDHIQPPLYLEVGPKELMEESMETQDNHLSSISEEEYKIEALEEEGG